MRTFCYQRSPEPKKAFQSCLIVQQLEQPQIIHPLAVVRAEQRLLITRLPVPPPPPGYLLSGGAHRDERKKESSDNCDTIALDLWTNEFTWLTAIVFSMWRGRECLANALLTSQDHPALFHFFYQQKKRSRLFATLKNKWLLTAFISITVKENFNY